MSNTPQNESRNDDADRTTQTQQPRKNESRNDAPDNRTFEDRMAENRSYEEKMEVYWADKTMKRTQTIGRVTKTTWAQADSTDKEEISNRKQSTTAKKNTDVLSGYLAVWRRSTSALLHYSITPIISLVLHCQKPQTFSA